MGQKEAKACVYCKVLNDSISSPLARRRKENRWDLRVIAFARLLSNDYKILVLQGHSTLNTFLKNQD